MTPAGDRDRPVAAAARPAEAVRPARTRADPPLGRAGGSRAVPQSRRARGRRRCYARVPIPIAPRTSSGTSRPRSDVRLIGERAALAIARFAAQAIRIWCRAARSPTGRSCEAAALAPANIRVDPAAGLFGLAVVERDRACSATPPTRAAVAQAIDRSALTAAFAPDWAPTEQLLPDAARFGRAACAARIGSRPRSTIAAPTPARSWRRGGTPARRGRPRPHRAARGCRRHAAVGADRAATCCAVGIAPERVAATRPPTCGWSTPSRPMTARAGISRPPAPPCGPAARAAIEAARIAPTARRRAPPRSPPPMRRSRRRRASSRSRGRSAGRWWRCGCAAWQPNARAWHPLNHLRADHQMTP